MATSKVLRAAPKKLLEKYTASIQYLHGPPSTVPDTAFIENDMVFSTGGYVYGPGVADKNIGFKFIVNDIAYTKFYVSGHGWLVLQHPSASPFDRDDVSTSNADSAQMLSQFLNYEHIVIAPWFDGSYKVPLNAYSLASSGSPYQAAMFIDTTPADISEGRDSRNWPYSHIDRGVRYRNFYDSKKGKYLIVRWTNSPVNFGPKLKFEVAIYENGTIEFRYWPLEYYEPGDSPATNSSATVGIFWNGITAGTANRFRDFAPLFNYQRDIRTISELGGASYDASYTDSGIPWSIGLDTSNWPKNGATIKFSPPVNLGKFLPRKISSLIDASKIITPRAGLFDDRKTFNFHAASKGKTLQTEVHMPSTLPSRLIGDTGTIDVSLRQSLFTSGSLRVSGSAKKHIIDSQLQLLDALENSISPSAHLSFNESQKNYQETAATSDFYATGSALEIFGDGFTAPLKSKTQFHFSLPVTKQTTMPSLTASFYYYDVNKKSWTLIDPNGYRQPASSFSYYLQGEEAGNLKFRDATGTDERGTEPWPTYRIVETSRGFDAVGRKIVSGTNNVDYSIQTPSWFPLSYQTDSAIGSIYNAKRFDNNGTMWFPRAQFLEESKSAITREYLNSVTDNSTFFPQKSQLFNFEIEEPFLIEKVVVSIPFYINGDWFNDLTTCTRPYVDPPYSINNPDAAGRFIGPIDFGGPGITFALMCARQGEGPNNSYLDLIASGTITHVNDITASVVLKKDPGMEHHCMRPTGFTAFSNPTCVLSGTSNIFIGNAKLEMEASVAGGLTFARNDRSYLTASFYNDDGASYVESNRDKARFLLCASELVTRGEAFANTYDRISSDVIVPDVGFVTIVSVLDGGGIEESGYLYRAPRIYLQQISPLSRGSAKMNFSGNSILGGNIATFNEEPAVKNPLYSGYTKAALPSLYTDQINSSSFRFDAVSIYSTVDSRPSPYLMLPGDKLTISMSKTRPAIDRAKDSGTQFQPFMGGVGARYDEYILTGSHGTVMLNTGSINITVYGSYIQEGVEYHP
jgi:hypothetical protein